MTARQRRALRTLERLVEDRTTFFKLDAPLMGRSAVKAEDQDRTLAALCRAMSGFESTNGYFAARPSQDPPDLGTEEAPCSGKEARPRLDFGRVCGKFSKARLKFPPPPSFSPYGYLDSKTFARYDRPLDFELPHGATPTSAEGEDPGR